MSWPEITGWSKTDPIPFFEISPRTSMPRPSMLGAIPQTSGATARTPGIRRRSSARLAGSVLKTGLGTFSRMTITPSIWLRVSPTRSRKPVGHAEKAHHSQDRHREPDQGQDGAKRPGQQVAPGESTHFPLVPSKGRSRPTTWRVPLTLDASTMPRGLTRSTSASKQGQAGEARSSRSRTCRLLLLHESTTAGDP